MQNKLRSFVADTVKHHDITGLNIAVVRGDELYYLDSYGYRNLAEGQELRPDHLFHMASISKTFTATAILKLAEEGRVDLDTPVINYLPYFKLDDPRYRQITLYHILNHTSGMPYGVDCEGSNPALDPGAGERYVRSLAGEKLDWEPGQKCRYSTMAYDILGDLIARVSGMDFEDYMKQNILDPLGMSQSRFDFPNTSEQLRTWGHTWDLQPVAVPHYPYNRQHASSSTLSSNVLEMTHWLRANLNGGSLNGTRIISEQSHARMWTTTAKVVKGRTIGLCWFIQKFNKQRAIFHTGRDPGFVSVIGMLPREKWGVVIASNYDYAPAIEMLNGVFEILVGMEPEVIKRDIYQTVVQTYRLQGLDAALTCYGEMETRHQNSFRFGPRQLNKFGRELMATGQMEEAQRVFQFNILRFAEEQSCWDSLITSFHATGDLEMARKFNQQALVLLPGFVCSAPLG